MDYPEVNNEIAKMKVSDFESEYKHGDDVIIFDSKRGCWIGGKFACVNPYDSRLPFMYVAVDEYGNAHTLEEDEIKMEMNLSL